MIWPWKCYLPSVQLGPVAKLALYVFQYLSIIFNNIPCQKYSLNLRIVFNFSYICSHDLLSDREVFNWLSLRPKVITLANNKGQRAIHCQINWKFEAITLREQVTISFGFTSVCWESGASFVSQSPSIEMQNQSKRKLLSRLKWKSLYVENNTGVQISTNEKSLTLCEGCLLLFICLISCHLFISLFGFPCLNLTFLFLVQEGF